MKNISLIIPFYNEEKVITSLFDELFKTINSISQYAFEIICINDGSNDNTLSLLKDKSNNHKNIKVISFSRNFGHDAAINAGVDYCNGDAAIILDGDLQDPPQFIPELIKKWEEGYDVVNIKRVDRKKDSFFKRSTAGLFYKIIRHWAYKINIEENVNNFRLISKRVIDIVKSLTSKNKVFRFDVPFAGFKTACIKISRPSRGNGESHYKLADMSRLAIDSIVSVSTQPLNLITKLFLVFFLLFLVSGITELTLFLIQHFSSLINISPLGYITWLIFNIIFFFSLLILFSIAIVAQYIARIHLETQNRPTYIIDEIIENNKE